MSLKDAAKKEDLPETKKAFVSLVGVFEVGSQRASVSCQNCSRQDSGAVASVQPVCADPYACFHPHSSPALFAALHCSRMHMHSCLPAACTRRPSRSLLSDAPAGLDLCVRHPPRVAAGPVGCSVALVWGRS